MAPARASAACRRGGVQRRRRRTDLGLKQKDLGLARSRSGRRTGTGHNPCLLIGATRTDRALRLEHDPQTWTERRRLRAAFGFFVRRRPWSGGAPPDPDVLKGLGRFRLSAVAPGDFGPGCPPCSPIPGNGLSASTPDARTRQIRIRNRQQDLHTGQGVPLASIANGIANWRLPAMRKLLRPLMPD